MLLKVDHVMCHTMFYPEAVPGQPHASKSKSLSRAESLYRELKREILTCALAPGTELHEVEIADTTGYGRSPVRDALKTLVHDGLVQVRPRQGYRVTPITLEDVHHVFELRLLLEPAAAELAIQRATQEQLERLHPLAHQTETGEDEHERFLTEHLEFHVAIAECAGNPRLAKAIRDLLDEMQRLIYLSRTANPDPSREHEHHELYEALLSRDTAAARQIVTAQIEQSRQRVATALAERIVSPGAASLAGLHLDRA
jgi:GntR family transcriptional regulator, rspAB operon transcriptional repressor